MADKKRIIGEKERASTARSRERYRQRLLQQGFRGKLIYLTVAEYENVKTYVKQIRGGKELAEFLKEREKEDGQ